MASLFTEEPKPATNKTEKKFPGNATQKAAWEKKENLSDLNWEPLKGE